MTLTSNRLEPIFKVSPVLFNEHVCFQSMAFPPRKAERYIIGLWRHGERNRIAHSGNIGAALSQRSWCKAKFRCEEFYSSQQTEWRLSPWRKVNTWESWQPCGRCAHGEGGRHCQVYANHLPQYTFLYLELLMTKYKQAHIHARAKTSIDMKID